MADPDEALIEAIAEAMWLDDLAFDGLTIEVASAEFPWPPEEGLADAYRHSARAAYAAMVEHLGLTEETRTVEELTAGWPGYRKVQQRRLVSRWTEVDHGSE